MKHTRTFGVSFNCTIILIIFVHTTHVNTLRAIIVLKLLYKFRKAFYIKNSTNSFINIMCLYTLHTHIDDILDMLSIVFQFLKAASG